MGKRKHHAKRVQHQLALLLLCGGIAHAQQEAILPLPEEVIPKKEGSVIMDLPDRLINETGLSMTPTIPSTIKVDNHGGDILYDHEKNSLTYEGKGEQIVLLTDNGTEMQAPSATALLDEQVINLNGPITIYQKEILAKASKGATFNWKDNTASAEGVRAKVNGLLVRGSAIEYKTDAEGKRYVVIRDAYVTTEDAEKPSTWIGTGTLTVYPGDYGRVTRLSIAGPNHEITVPILGWFSFSHSLNPREGYMPNMGTKSIWGAYLLNSYGVLLGNRRVDGVMPTADYLLTTHADIYSRRGLAFGLDFEDIAMTKKHHEMKGLQTYLVPDKNPMINPQKGNRKHTRHNRYRVAMQAEWDITPDSESKADWQLVTNINALSDRYLLRDFFEEESRVDSSPDNTVRIERRDRDTHSMVFTRFAPNDFYATDERIEGSFYRVRQPIGKTGITYETKNSAGVMRQYLPISERISYQNKLNNLKDESVRDYYERLINTNSYMRVSTTHELSTSFKVLRFLNVTPKAGAGYTGYYDVGGVGSDNRFLGYLGCDFDIKFHNHFSDFVFEPFGYNGLTHVFHPYASFSHTNLSSAKTLVPQLDTWSSSLGSSTNSPMPLDLIGFTGIDAWDSWSIWRLGVRNTFNTEIDGNQTRLIDWNTFIDYNLDNPLTEREYSNLYSVFEFRPTMRTRFYIESQTPTIQGGEGYRRYNVNVAHMPFAWLEAHVGYRDFNGHPIYADSEQLETKVNLRLSEKYTTAFRWTWDISEKRMPIQQYSIFRNAGPWYIGATFFVRDNGGKHEQGFGISFTLGETGTALPVNIL